MGDKVSVTSGDVETETVESLHATEESVVAGTARVDDRAGTVVAESGSGNVESVLGRDQARNITSSPALVGLVAEVHLEPCGSELSEAGQRESAALVASASTLSVAVGSDVLSGTSLEVEGQSLVASEESVDTMVLANLVPALADGVATVVVDLDGVVVLVGNAALDEHPVATKVVISTNVTLVGDLAESGTLDRTLGAAAERLVRAVATAAGAGSSVGLRSGRLASLGGRGRRGRRSGALRRRSSGRLRRRGRRRRSRLLGHDKLSLASLKRAMGVAVGVARRVGRNANGGGEDDSRELHCVLLDKMMLVIFCWVVTVMLFEFFVWRGCGIPGILRKEAEKVFA